jgi:hypothetical protein
MKIRAHYILTSLYSKTAQDKFEDLLSLVQFESQDEILDICVIGNAVIPLTGRIDAIHPEESVELRIGTSKIERESCFFYIDRTSDCTLYYKVYFEADKNRLTELIRNEGYDT